MHYWARAKDGHSGKIKLSEAIIYVERAHFSRQETAIDGCFYAAARGRIWGRVQGIFH
jgi:hypothetical protein